MKKKLSIIKFIFNLIGGLLIIALIEKSVLGLVSIAADNEQDVNISITPNPNIDIVLSKAKTATSVTTFESDIKNALDRKGIDTSNVKVSAVETVTTTVEESDAEEIFNNWNSYSVSDSNITRSTTSPKLNSYTNTTASNEWEIVGDKIQRKTENRTLSLFRSSEFNEDTSINFSTKFGLNVANSSVHGEAWWFFRIDESMQNGYAIVWDNHSACGPFSASDYKLYVIKMENGVISILEEMTVKKWALGEYWDARVEIIADVATITISGSDSMTWSDIDVSMSVPNTQAFGTYWFNGSYFSSNKVEREVVKKYSEVLRLPEWRKEAERFIVNISDYENDELNDNTAYSELLTRLMNEGIYYVAWGNDTNKNQFENLITSNNGNGTFTNNSDYNQAIEDTATYIKSIIDRIQTTSSQYVIVNEPIKVNVSPSGIMNNTIDSNWPFGKWLINHNYTYFENDMGQFAESGKLINNLLTTFDKTGKYEIYYKNNIVYPNEIYVHRKPVAQIVLNRNGNNISLTSDSYDEDEISTATKGIAEEEWKWKTSDTATWTTGKLTTIDSSKDYTISLRVKDNQEKWSDIETVYITSDLNSLPIAQFNFTNSNITKYEELEINDTSYDPAGGGITNRLWEVYKGDNLIYSDNTPKTDYSSESNGEYTVYLTVTNDRGLVSEKYGRKFTIIDDTIAPEVVVTPTSCDWKETETVHLEFTDQGGSGVKNYKYAITDSQATPSTWNTPIAGTSGDIEINQEGVKYLHIIAEDNAGNVSDDRITGPYKIDKGAPQLVISGDFTNEKLDTLQFTIQATDSGSGLKSVKVNDQQFSVNTYTATKNGTYTVVAEDYAGNLKTEVVTINNIYYECPNNLGHPHYSSDYDSCPICAQFESGGSGGSGSSSLQVTNANKVYDGTLQGVSYNNPNNATIVEYYNNVNQKVRDAGTYQYSLKVVYDGNEYDTGLSGTFTISKKSITISDLQATSRVYDTTNVVRLSGGTLQGVVSGDDVSAVIPETGILESSEVGTWKVRIDDIQLAGTDAGNYTLVQPEYGSITATITQASPELVIECLDKTYDGMPVQPRKVSGSNLSQITYTFYRHGETTPIGVITQLGGGVNAKLQASGNSDVPINAGTYDVVGHQESDGHYEAVTSQKVTFTIGKKEITVTGIQGQDRNYDGTNIVDLVGGTLQGVITGDNVTAVIPEKGISENKSPGTWKVSINNIQLTGTDASNYILMQPQYGSITVTIVRASSQLVIECPNKVYDGRPLEARKVSGSNTSEVKYVFYRHGGLNPIEGGPKDVGEYDVIGYQESDENYEITISERLLVKILPKEITISGLQAQNKEYNSNNIVDLTGGTLQGVLVGDEVNVVIPETGTAESSNPGTWRVTVGTIELIGADVGNYTLVQPQYGSITATIIRATTELVIECESKVYDGRPVTPRKVSGNNTSEITYTYYKHGESTPIGTMTQLGRGMYSRLMASESAIIIKNAGTYDLVAHQEHDGNYEAVTSEKITFTISKKEITIEGITAESRDYNETDIVNLSGGTLQGVVEGDSVSAVIPRTGISENKNIGTWNVNIGRISLSGTDALNYTLIQPGERTVTVTIGISSSDLKIECVSKVYDGKAVEAKKISGKNTSKVEYKYYNHGEAEEIDVPKDVGEYDVVGYQESDGNYEVTTSEKITFKITPKELTIEGIEATNKEYDGTTKVAISGGIIKGILDGDKVTATIPTTGTASSKEVGTWKVELDEIKLSGSDASNYIVKQPDNITVKITKQIVIDTTVATIAIPYTGEMKVTIWTGIIISTIIGIASYIKIRKGKTI